MTLEEVLKLLSEEFSPTMFRKLQAAINEETTKAFTNGFNSGIGYAQRNADRDYEI